VKGAESISELQKQSHHLNEVIEQKDREIATEKHTNELLTGDRNDLQKKFDDLRDLIRTK